MADSLRERVDDAVDEFEDRIMDDPHENDPSDWISEIADSNCPIYNSDILQLAVDNLFLALDEPEIGPAFDGSPTPVNIIAANIYEHLSGELHSRWRDIQDSMIDDDHDIAACYLATYNNTHDMWAKDRMRSECNCDCHEVEYNDET